MIRVQHRSRVIAALAAGLPPIILSGSVKIESRKLARGKCPPQIGCDKFRARGINVQCWCSLEMTQGLMREGLDFVDPRLAPRMAG